MAVYHFSTQVFTRSKGHSAVGKAAYRAAEKLHDERLEKTFDYSKKSDVFYKEIMLSKNAPERFLDRETLWNEVEACEKREDSQLAREIEVSLPDSGVLNQLCHTNFSTTEKSYFLFIFNPNLSGNIMSSGSVESTVSH